MVCTHTQNKVSESLASLAHSEALTDSSQRGDDTARTWVSDRSESSVARPRRLIGKRLQSTWCETANDND